VIGLGAVFTLARFSEAFLVLQQQSGVPLALIPLVMCGHDVLYSSVNSSWHKLSDGMSHTRLLQWGLVMLIGADIVLALSTHWAGMLLGVALWGSAYGDDAGAAGGNDRKNGACGSARYRLRHLVWSAAWDC
jgi:hypothetical protein